MEATFKKIIDGYKAFRTKYVQSEHSVMQHLSSDGQHPEIMVIACCDSRVDPALILQCEPGDLFVVRNVANIVPPFSKKNPYYEVCAALEFGIGHLKIKHLIILGHSQCGGINALVNNTALKQNDAITQWVSLLKNTQAHFKDTDNYAKLALMHSYHNCLSYDWINERVKQKNLAIHLWYFNINAGEVLNYSHQYGKFQRLDDEYVAFDP